MQRWFFLEEKKKRKKEKSSDKMNTDQQKPSHSHKKKISEKLSETWMFSVSVVDIGQKEQVFITGGIAELGDWDPAKIVPLEHKPNTDVWFKSVIIPNTVDVLYRYVIGLLNEDTNDIRICRLESNLKPRILKSTQLHPELDIFGHYEDKKNISRGWLLHQSTIQFKFVHNPLNLKARYAGRLMNIKVTPVNLSFGNEPQVEDSADTMDVINEPSGVSIEVATLSNNTALCKLTPQEQFGREYKPNDILLINVTVPKINSLAFLIDFYSYSSRASSDDPPCHIGYTYVLPNMFKPSEGSLQLPVTCNVKHRPLGTINFEYLIIHPMEQKLNDLEVSYAKHWDPSWTGLEVGHRGLGASFKTKEGTAIRENTIASLKKAAASGADLLEFDVQLSKDMIPVIYHDFHVCISMKRKKEVNFTDMLELPVKDLTLEHLQKLKVYHLVEGRNHEILFFDEDLDEHQPFPTLEDVLNTIDTHVGFNIELKWTMELSDGTFELNNPFDMNTYVDKILEIILKHAGDRRIVISCFNPDICTMVRNKQNKYPVMFLTCVKLATDAGLVIFCWGDDNNDKNTIKKLKEMGLHAVIYDKLDQYITKEVKESIFLVEARESERELMRLAALDEGDERRSDSDASERSPPGAFLDLRLRAKLPTTSTVTSLESLAEPDGQDQHDHSNKRLIEHVAKEDQLKECSGYRNTFKGMFPAGDSSKKPRQSK